VERPAQPRGQEAEVSGRRLEDGVDPGPNGDDPLEVSVTRNGSKG
jgi:hypothetical protein